jgi:hypothetical protein
MMPGASAQREYERRRAARQEQLQRSWRLVAILIVVAFIVGWVVSVAVTSAVTSMLGAVVSGEGSGLRLHSPPVLVSAAVATGMAALAALQLLSPSHAEKAWGKGAAGERVVGAALDRLPGDQVRVLHDRRMPRSRANLDHIAVTRSGVFTIDAKRYAGRLEARGRGQQLWIAGRDRSKLLDQAHRQAEAVAGVLAEAGLSEVQVTPALCFVDTELPRFFRPKHAGGVQLTTPRDLPTLLGAPAPADAGLDLVRIATVLDAALPPADQPTTASGTTSRKATAGMANRTDAAGVTEGAMVCPRCGEALVERRRRSDGNRFLGCKGFPACRHTAPLA